jgi:hypothetical protein
MTAIRFAEPERSGMTAAERSMRLREVSTERRRRCPSGSTAYAKNWYILSPG